jgi:purine-binding chemotaxis protein CheW
MAAATASEDGSALICRAGRVLCALPVGALVETMRPLPLEQLPGAPPSVIGTAVVRGTPLPVVDIGRLLGDQASGIGRYVVVRAGAHRVALAFAEVLGFRQMDKAKLDELPPLLGAASSVAVAALGTLDGALLLLLKAASVVPEDLLVTLAAEPRRP